LLDRARRARRPLLGDTPLTGNLGLGVFPLRDDGTVRFAAIDLDIYPIDPKPVLDEVRRLELPLIPCRSKSGGVHWFVFFSDDVPASLARRTLRNWAAALGHKDSEIFPKQDRLDTRTPDGSWLNMPYFGGFKGYCLRYAYGPDGTAMTIEEFLDAAERSRISLEQLRSWPVLPPAPDPNTPVIDDDFGEHESAGFENVDESHPWHEGKGPEHWQRVARGLGRGERHEGVKSLAGLLFATVEPMLAEVLVRLYAENQCDPPFGQEGREVRELNDIIRWFAARELEQ